MDLASFHLQSSKYDNSRPPAFGEHPELTCLERERERINEPSMREWELRIDDIMAQQESENNPGPGSNRDIRSIIRRLSSKTIDRQLRREEQQKAEARKRQLEEEGKRQRAQEEAARRHREQQKKSLEKKKDAMEKKNKGVNSVLTGVLKGGVGRKFNSPLVEQVVTTSRQSPKSARGDNHPSLLLQEGAHLLSLLSAVAMSTLRNDLEEADSPLITFTPGAPWPHVDPDAYGADIRKGWSRSSHKSFTVLSYLFGTSRTPASRTLYNAARPFRVIGGVSDAEIEVLQAAKGPYAKGKLNFSQSESWMEKAECHGSTWRGYNRESRPTFPNRVHSQLLSAVLLLPLPLFRLLPTKWRFVPCGYKNFAVVNSCMVVWATWDLQLCLACFSRSVME